MRVLTVTSLYPNTAQPNHAVFVENRMRRVHETGEAEITVIAPTPWFPSKSRMFGSYAVHAAVPRRETRHGIAIHHPRYAMIPKIGMQAQPKFYHRALRRTALKLIEETGPFDLIDAHYFYPDGVAAALLAEELGIPFTCTARGTDVNQIPAVSDFGKRAVLETAVRAAASITVCEALRQELIALGADGAKIHTLRNGVDLEAFRAPLLKALPPDMGVGLGGGSLRSESAAPFPSPPPAEAGRGDAAAPRSALKTQLGIPAEAPLVVSVGGLVERKGHHLTIDAVAALDGVHLLIVGSGAERGALEARIEGLGVGDRVRLVGSLPHADLSNFYGAADLSVLASSREGWANVLLESMACGTPVVATSIWGNPEVVAAPEAGLLAEERTAPCLQKQIAALLADPPDRAATRAYAERFSWDGTVRGVIEVFKAAVEGHHSTALTQS